VKAEELVDVEAIRELAKCFQFALGLERNVATAARLHVKTAMMGDLASQGNLTDYRQEIENEAFAGSLRAALATMYENGLGVEKSLAVAYARLMVGMQLGFKDDDGPVRDELYDRDLTMYMDLTSDEKTEAWALFEQCERVAAKQP